MTFLLYQDAKGGWRWRLRSGNNRIIADSGESYTRFADAERSLDAIQDACNGIADAARISEISGSRRAIKITKKHRETARTLAGLPGSLK
jgi:uncharacterized protein YegP (UPF0339 family)